MQPPEERRSSAARAQLDGLYAKIHDEAAVRALTKLHFDADAWRTVRCRFPVWDLSRIWLLGLI